MMDDEPRHIGFNLPLAVELVVAGETITMRPRGNSMGPLIDSGDLVRITPRGEREPRKGDIVLTRVSGNIYLHLVKAIDGRRFQIGNNRGGINGWTGLDRIYGFVTNIEHEQAG